MTTMKIEVFYFEGCPNHRPAVERLKQVLQEEGITADLAEVEVRDQTTAQAVRFLGSPTLHINGVDMEPSARSAQSFGLTCRTYTEGGKLEGAPSRELIRAAVRQAAGSGPHACCAVASLPTAISPRPETAKPHSLRLLGSSLMAALAASLCCILPIVAAITGLAGLTAAASFEQWRPYFLTLTGALLVAGGFLAYRDYKKACVPGSLCATQPMNRWNGLALGLLTVLVVALAAFPAYSGYVAQRLVPPPAHSTRAATPSVTTSFLIPDMSCPACATTLRAQFEQLPGVSEAKVDYETRRATITYNPVAQNFEAFANVVRDAGYHISKP